MPRAQTDDGIGLSYEVRGDGPRNLLFLHGWAYDADGACVRIPALRDGHIPGRARVPRLAVVEHLGVAWVCLTIVTVIRLVVTDRSVIDALLTIIMFAPIMIGVAVVAAFVATRKPQLAPPAATTAG